MAKIKIHHHVITFSAGTGVGVFAIIGLLTDKASQLIEASETTEACTDLIQSILSIF